MPLNADQTDIAPSRTIKTPLRCGVDVVSIGRIEKLLAEFCDSFRDRVFTLSEQRYCERQGYPPQHYAARWAVKEAFVKAISSETQPIPLQDIGVTHEGKEPTLILTPRARAAVATTVETDCPEQIVTAVSLSHDRDADQAIGQVILCRGDNE